MFIVRCDCHVTKKSRHPSWKNFLACFIFPWRVLKTVKWTYAPNRILIAFLPIEGRNVYIWYFKFMMWTYRAFHTFLCALISNTSIFFCCTNSDIIRETEFREIQPQEDFNYCNGEQHCLEKWSDSCIVVMRDVRDVWDVKCEQVSKARKNSQANQAGWSVWLDFIVLNTVVFSSLFHIS